MYKKLATLAALAATPLLVNAQVAVWDQCGGGAWTGPTNCVAGTICVVMTQWWSQCQPGSTPPPPPPPPTNPAGNPYPGFDVWRDPHYSSQATAAAQLIADPVQAAKARRIAEVPLFIWFDTVAKVPSLDTYLSNAKAQQTSTGRKVLVQIVIYNMPDRDCSASAATGEFTVANGGVARYKNYIDQIAAIIRKYPELRVVAIIEPDALPNMATSRNFPRCEMAAAAYEECTVYALRSLNALGVYMYLDGGHTGWLGWPSNIPLASAVFANMYIKAGRPAYVRGIATNISNFNALRSAAPTEVNAGNPNWDESKYIAALAPSLANAGFPAKFIVDQGRAGHQNIRPSYDNWCNLKGAGFGPRPGSSTGSSDIDQIVWVKGGGQSDGTSNRSSSRFDPNCALSTALENAPEAGQWFQAYFEMLVRNANPPL